LSTSTCGTPGEPAQTQCEGCTFFNGQVRELSYLHSRDVNLPPTFCDGPYDESIAYRDFMGWEVPWYSAEDSASALLAGRWFGMQVCYLPPMASRCSRQTGAAVAPAEALAPTYALLDMTVYGPAGGLGGLSSRLATALRNQR